MARRIGVRAQFGIERVNPTSHSAPNWDPTPRYGVLPQVLPVMLSNVLYTFESNTRSATILGIVGAGGIGFYLSDRVRTMNWEDASFILLLILLTVYLIDRFSGFVRSRLIQGQTAKQPA